MTVLHLMTVARHVCDSPDFATAVSDAKAEAANGDWVGIIESHRPMGVFGVFAWPMKNHPIGSEIVKLGIVAWEVPSSDD